MLQIILLTRNLNLDFVAVAFRQLHPVATATRVNVSPVCRTCIKIEKTDSTKGFRARGWRLATLKGVRICGKDEPRESANGEGELASSASAQPRQLELQNHKLDLSAANHRDSSMLSRQRRARIKLFELSRDSIIAAAIVYCFHLAKLIVP